MSKSEIVNKSFRLGVLAVKIAYFIQKEKKEYVVSRQFVRAATSIGANVQEAQGSQTDKEFYTKICISYKEARESMYWLQLLVAAEIISSSEVEDLISLIDELVRMLGSTKMTLQKKLSK